MSIIKLKYLLNLLIILSGKFTDKFLILIDENKR